MSPREAGRLVAAQPAVHGLSRDPVAQGDLGDTAAAGTSSTAAWRCSTTPSSVSTAAALPDRRPSQVVYSRDGWRRLQRIRGVTQVPKPRPELVNAPTGATVERMYRDRTLAFSQGSSGADAGNRTPDPIITSDVLCQLSYVGPRKEA